MNFVSVTTIQGVGDSLLTRCFHITETEELVLFRGRTLTRWFGHKATFGLYGAW